MRDDSDTDLEKLSRQFSYYASSEIKAVEADHEVAISDVGALSGKGTSTGSLDSKESVESTSATASDKIGDPNLLLGILFEVTTLMTQKAHFNTILEKVLEGIHRGIGFDRAVLCLLNPKHTAYAARMLAGNNTEPLEEYFSFDVDVEKDLFSKIIMEGSELLVTDIEQGGWRQQLPKDFQQKTGANSFILGSLRSKTRPIGVFYADKAQSGAPITEADHRSFNQLVAQAQLALQMR